MFWWTVHTLEVDVHACLGRTCMWGLGGHSPFSSSGEVSKTKKASEKSLLLSLPFAFSLEAVIFSTATEKIITSIQLKALLEKDIDVGKSFVLVYTSKPLLILKLLPACSHHGALLWRDNKYEGASFWIATMCFPHCSPPFPCSAAYHERESLCSNRCR